MIIINKELLENFAKSHADIRNALQKWILKVEESQWKLHAELKQDYPSVDYVGNGRYVFDIRGNKYRLIVVIVFIAGLIDIRFIETHAEYDKIKADTI